MKRRNPAAFSIMPSQPFGDLHSLPDFSYSRAEVKAINREESPTTIESFTQIPPHSTQSFDMP